MTICGCTYKKISCWSSKTTSCETQEQTTQSVGRARAAIFCSEKHGFIVPPW